VTDLLVILVIKTFQQALRPLPEKIQQAVGVCLGRLAFVLLRTRRVVALSNIRRVFTSFSEADAIGLAKSCFEKLGINFVESIVLPYLRREEYPKRFTIENRHYVEQAAGMNKGVIALVFHYANWEIMGVASRLLEKEVVVLARPLKRHKLINRFLSDLRSATGLTIIPNQDTGRDVMRHLRENRIVAILGDQREKRSRGVWVDFFGHEVPTNKGIATIAMKTGAPVIPFYFVRRGFLRYVIVCNKPLEMERRGNIEELVRRNTRRINAFLESIITEQPDEWFWVHRRWGRGS
jgi:Kdo2-lipid IVA lauroyltransferase/acyltransferase